MGEDVAQRNDARRQEVGKCEGAQVVLAVYINKRSRRRNAECCRDHERNV